MFYEGFYKSFYENLWKLFLAKIYISNAFFIFQQKRMYLFF